MSKKSDRYVAAKTALDEHFNSCPAGCTTNHIKCDDGYARCADEDRAWMESHHEMVMMRTLVPGEPVPWDLKDARFRWLLDHIKTCTVCEWRNEDDSSRLCPAAERYFAAPAAHEMAAAGTPSLFDLDGGAS